MDSWRRFRRHKLAVFGLAALAVLVVMAVFAPFVAPYDPNAISLGEVYNGPTKSHFLGTDQIGRDVLSRLIFAGRVSLAVGLGAVAIQVSLGVTLGLVSGLSSRIVDEIIQRAVEVFLSFPSLILVFIFVAVLGPSLLNVIISIGVFGWPYPCRLTRGEVLSAREMDYILAARAYGASTIRIALRHILPNIIAPILVASSLLAATAILYEAALSFLGLGVQPPTATWGIMMRLAQKPNVLKLYPWIWLSPGVMVSLTVISINFVGDALRDALDPRHGIR